MNKSVQHLQNIGKYDLWETPKDILTDACARYSIFPKLDVCATSNNKKFHLYFGSDNFFPEIHNAFDCEWDIDFFMNPPYSEIGKWMQKAYYEHKKHNVNALILTFSKTDTEWWHKYVEDYAEIHNIKGRVKFLKDGIKSKNSAPYPSCWIIFRKNLG